MAASSPKEVVAGATETFETVGVCTDKCPGWEGQVEDGKICPLHHPDGRCEVDYSVPAVKWQGKWYVVDDATAARIERELHGPGR